MKRPDAVEQLIERGAVAVVRLPMAEHGVELADALLAGGVSAIEVTLTTRGAFDLITTLVNHANGALMVGAGSVTDARSAQQAIDAGASYVVSPVFDEEVLVTAHGQDIPVFPGAYTPTEILRAQQAGADLVKVFPADTLGPRFIKSVLAPMPFLRLMPTGGVTPANVGEWIKAGAVAVGLGSALVDQSSIASRDFATITARGRAVIAGIAAARAAMSDS